MLTRYLNSSFPSSPFCLATEVGTWRRAQVCECVEALVPLGSSPAWSWKEVVLQARVALTWLGMLAGNLEAA